MTPWQNQIIENAGVKVESVHRVAALMSDGRPRTIRDMMNALSIHQSSALRAVKKLLAAKLLKACPGHKTPTIYVKRSA